MTRRPRKHNPVHLVRFTVSPDSTRQQSVYLCSVSDFSAECARILRDYHHDRGFYTLTDDMSLSETNEAIAARAEEVDTDDMPF